MKWEITGVAGDNKRSFKVPALISVRIIASLLAVLAIAAGRWTQKMNFMMYIHVHSPGLGSVSPIYSSKPAEQSEDSKAVLLAPMITKANTAIEIAIDQYKNKREAMLKQDPKATSAKKAEGNGKTDTLFADLEAVIQSNLDDLSGKRVRVKCVIVDVVPFKTPGSNPNPPEYVTHVLLGRARLITGLSPEGSRKLAEARNRKYPNEQYKADTLKKINEEDQLSHCVGIYFFGTSELADLKVGNSIDVEGNLRKVGVYGNPKSTTDSEFAFEIDIQGDAKTATTKPTSQSH